MKSIVLKKRGAFEVGMKEVVLGAVILMVILFLLWKIIANKLDVIFQ